MFGGLSSQNIGTLLWSHRITNFIHQYWHWFTRTEYLSVGLM